MVLREDTSEIMNIMGEAIADIALDEAYYPSAIEQARSAGLENLRLVDEFVGSRPELQWHRPCAGLIGFCRLRMGIDSESFCKRLLQAPYRTLVIPGTAYGRPRHIRLGMGGSAAANLADGLRRMGHFLDDLEAG